MAQPRFFSSDGFAAVFSMLIALWIGVFLCRKLTERRSRPLLPPIKTDSPELPRLSAREFGEQRARIAIDDARALTEVLRHNFPTGFIKADKIEAGVIEDWDPRDEGLEDWLK